ncbi:DNA double-strand break repair nuclease NurA [Desulfothermobacter acidiphilus]|uniref:DNA double-strand break repair nuclease NurA n=1 Tax=Desulfothermobacter acidiphilus TaxID=1938353 RepID=UPI003F8C27B2
MQVSDSRAVERLRAFVSLQRRRWDQRPETEVLRRRLAQVGCLYRVEPKLLAEQLVAVDGSLGTVGSRHPYTLTLLRAAAFALPPFSSPVSAYEVFSPLWEPEFAGGSEQEDSLVNASEQKVRELMTSLELEVALQALAASRVKLLLLDGGFVPFRERAENLFQRLRQKALDQGTFLVGVIEEVASRRLAEVVSDLWLGPPPHDREILYGCLGVGEALILPEKDKRGRVSLVRAFARFAAHPQPVAFNFLPEQAEEVPLLLAHLRALTPADGRGIPCPIDLADREVRLQQLEVERLVAAVVPAELREFLLGSHRCRRPF